VTQAADDGKRETFRSAQDVKPQHFLDTNVLLYSISRDPAEAGKRDRFRTSRPRRFRRSAAQTPT